MPYQINKHPKYYKYKVCKKPGTIKKTSKKSKSKNSKKTMKRRPTKKVVKWNSGKKCFSKKWLTKKRAQKQRTAILLSELGISRK
jgi:hypothetical protein